MDDTTTGADAVTATTDAARRPIVVSVAVAFVYVTGLLSILLGILVLLSRYDQSTSGEVLAVSLIGAAIILLGLLIIGIASGVARGSRLSRITLTVYLAIQVPLHVLAIATADFDWIATVQLALEVFTLVVLWLPPTNRFFRAAAGAGR
ncbi:hypothetical protein IT882_12660 [Microbacterium schleiferi]|uniref:Uncharacterized protein n=1 Tax=Microbacterium schleiferi TaxID=69362 RepID=A0A7S8MVN0_9MICO|nr:hypothetical protein [Microbacterium schleiferi]QPE04055.1 hypothetical protein IT882_12660 [Microbacterium schleiferi]